jgi:hypothetical protein
MFLQDENVHHVRDYGEIGHHPRKTHKTIAFVVNSEAQRVLNGLPYRLYCPVFPPIGSVADEIMDDRHIQSPSVGGYHIAVIQLLSPFCCRRRESPGSKALSSTSNFLVSFFYDFRSILSFKTSYYKMPTCHILKMIDK